MSDVNETNEPVDEEELDPFEEEIAALGPPPGPDWLPSDIDAYNRAVDEIKSRQYEEAEAAAEEAAVVDPTEDRRFPEESVIENHGSGNPGTTSDDGTGRAAGT